MRTFENGPYQQIPRVKRFAIIRLMVFVSRTNAGTSGSAELKPLHIAYHRRYSRVCLEGGLRMQQKLDLLGAITAHIIFISSIITFASRMIFKLKPGHWVGIPILIMAFPLVYLLVRAPELDRPVLYYIQIGVMLVWLIVLFLVDYVFRFDFRQTQWMVISYVVLYFAGMGGMIGISAQAGRGWMISAIILFFIAAVLAFIQRAVTGI
jgi:hypothetical protein